MKYIALVDRTAADYGGRCAEKFTEAFLIGEMETIQSVFQRIKKDFPAEQIRVVPLHEINQEVEK